jgi:hypothetical protein
MNLLTIQFPLVAVISSLLGQNTLFSTLFASTVSLGASLSVADEILRHVEQAKL